MLCCFVDVIGPTNSFLYFISCYTLESRGCGARTGALPASQLCKFNGSCYFVVKQKTTWYLASRRCHLQHSNLVDIHTAPENNFVMKLARSAISENVNAWIGITSIGPNPQYSYGNQWRWGAGNRVLGSKSQYFNAWASNEPNLNPRPHSKNFCGALWLTKKDEGNVWDDVPCWYDDRYYVCERGRCCACSAPLSSSSSSFSSHSLLLLIKIMAKTPCQ